MIRAALLAALAWPAAAQSPMPYSGEAPAASPAVSTAPAVSTTTAVAASTDTLANVVSSKGVGIGGGAPKVKLERPMHATIHADAKDWEPVSLKAGGDPFQAETAVVLRQAKVRGKYKGTASSAKASARLHKAGPKDRWLVVCVYPKALARRRAHFEVRLKIVEGFVEDAKVALISVIDRRPGAGESLDSTELREQGVEFEEDSPESGALSISAIEPRPSKTAVNSGKLKQAAFVAEAVGLADVSWSVKGLTAPK